MTPPCHSFPASELPLKAQHDARGRRRKLDGSALLDLSACPLLQMLQYKCEVQRPAVRDSPVQCFAVQRLFRKCKDKKSSFMVETTAWEGKAGWDDGPAKPADDAAEPPKPYQWSSNWHDADEAPR
ncbi:mitochondrial export protein [Hirsutella rhossiliensis]|uniref:Mitochondrial export protein n=1 Tax=Hirsutella rhossiliensis TaxID=111463 RepID=A0A9P8SLH0_9HYPO|nr:mitochondrial export protein [Hirsutella rhossiliensis]KAH0967473.1 mitochondrial export protein [Hirsutella rhossiliensis]